LSFVFKLFTFFIVNFILFFIAVLLDFPNMFVYAAFIFITSIIIAYVLYRKGEQRIWYFPLSQIVMVGSVCAFLLITDRFGSGHSGTWINFGVEWIVQVLLLTSAFWIVPSLITATAYEIIMRIFRI